MIPKRWIDAIRNSIVAKLWLTIVSMVVIVLFLLAFLLQQFFDGYVYAQQSNELARLARTVELVAVHNSEAEARHVAGQLAAAQDASVTISQPYSDNPQFAVVYQRFSSSDRVAFDEGRPVSVQETSPDGSAVVSVYLKIPGPEPGVIAVTQRMSVLDEPLSYMRKLIVFAMAIGIVLTTGLAFVISKNTSRPLLQMNKVAEEMARGNFDWQIDVVTNDEVGQLGRTFNKLAQELEQTIAALSMEKDQLKSILTSLEDGVVAADLEGHVTLTNPPAERWLRSFALAETDDPEMEVQVLPDMMRRMMSAVVEINRPVVREWTWQGRYLVVTMTPLHQADAKKLRGVVAVLRDVTEERRLDRLRKDFIANVSHELRTPLSMMQGYAEALLDEFGDDPVQRRELAEIIHDETLRMRRLVNDLLDLAQLESGHFQMNFDEVDIAALVRRMARKFQTLAAERGVELGAAAPDAPVWVRADVDRMEQVFTNLLDNAIRHTGAGGSVWMDVTVTGSNVRIRVADTGTGIPEEDIPFIWERFYKADKARTRGAGGTGLGLAITRQIVLEHGGNINVESQLGKGTTFTVVLPLVACTLEPKH